MKRRSQCSLFVCSLLILFAITAPTLYAGDGCDMTGLWRDGFNFNWTLEQDEEGALSGALQQHPACAGAWPVEGSVDGHSFDWLTRCPCDPDCLSGTVCQNFTYTGTLASDCNSGSGTWANCMIFDGVFTINRTSSGLVVDFEINGTGPGAPARQAD